MTLRAKHSRATAAAMAGFGTSTGYRVERDPRLPSRKKASRGHGGGRPDPLADIWDSEIVPMLARAPGLRPVTILAEPTSTPARFRAPVHPRACGEQYVPPYCTETT